MTYTISELEIIYEDSRETFEAGKDGIQTITIDKENHLLLIEYEDDRKWDIRILPFDNLKSFQYKKIRLP